IRLLIAIGGMMALNWRIVLTALAIVPAAMLMRFVFVSRISPIYRTLRKDPERFDGRDERSLCSIRVGRAYRLEMLKLCDYVTGQHIVVGKERFAERRELVLWTSWGLVVSAVNVVIIWYGGALNIAGRASVGDIMAFQWYTFLLLNPVWAIVNSFSE